MLLLYQSGSVKIGEVVRYTVTYTPARDRILPSPEVLFLRIKNTSAIALRAAFVHGPYTLSVAAYPAHFKPNDKFENPRRYGVPEFEPMLKASGTWDTRLLVPDAARQSAGTGGGTYSGGGSESGAVDEDSVSWVVEVTSQVIFSTSAAVHYEILLGRDEKSLEVGSAIAVVGGQAQVPQPGRVSDLQQSAGARAHPAQPKGLYSRAISLKVEDTAALWNKPALPGWDEMGWLRAKGESADAQVESVVGDSDRRETARSPPRKQKKVHLVILTHGLHGNLGADMLFLKESIDAGAKQAKIDARAKRAREKANAKRKEKMGRSAENEAPGSEEGLDNGKTACNDGTNNVESGTTEDTEDEGVDDDEEVIVRGFSGNATKTEKGIKYLGKRLARYILSMTYPDQPFLPTAKAASEAIAHTLKASSQRLGPEGPPVHKHSTILKRDSTVDTRLYSITKISFIGHSLGGLIQTYAIAYIQKHSPQFFDLIQPINFISLASPFLGLNHENPLYVKFALDFGLVGRTGQDLGLTWRAPTLARSGWGALVSNLGENAHKRVYGEMQAESKPLLRILPTGPAHTALKKFRNRTVYSNVVNDGIVPLRTSCLLFLDWQGLGRVEKARREAGLVETVMGFGWAELTGANVNSPKMGSWTPVESQDEPMTDKPTPIAEGGSHEVPQPPSNATLEDDRQSIPAKTSYDGHDEPAASPSSDLHYSSSTNNANPFTGFFNFFRSSDTPRSPSQPSQKTQKIYQRSQTLKISGAEDKESSTSSKARVTAGNETDEDNGGVLAPPRTTFFESAGDLLNPKLPSVEYLIDPSKRPRTIFHDRIYHPEDIPPPPLKKRPTGSPLTMRRKSFPLRSSPSVAPNSSVKTPDTERSSPFSSPRIQYADSAMSKRDYVDEEAQLEGYSAEIVDSSQMKVEEKIARAYHRDLSWRKVLVKLEPDAHNNIIVRRMFANAFGWPVIHHLVEAHFSYSATARMRDEDESNSERAKQPNEPPDEHGGETKGSAAKRETGTPGRSDEKDPETPMPLSTAPRPGNPNTASSGRDAARRHGADPAPPDPPGSPQSGSDSKTIRAGVLSSSASSSDDDEDSSDRPSRPRLQRADSVSWTEQDWIDSEEEEHKVTKSPGSENSKWNPVKAAAGVPILDPLGVAVGGSASAWNWTEKFVGKGATQLPRRSQSP